MGRMKLEGEMKKQGLNWLKRSFETGKLVLK